MDPSSTSLPSTIPHIPMDKLFGSVLIGTFLGLVFYGITLHQFYRYSRMYPSDMMILKVAVLLTVMLETVHVALSCHTWLANSTYPMNLLILNATSYYFLISSFFQPEKLGVATHPMEWLPVTSVGLDSIPLYLDIVTDQWSTSNDSSRTPRRYIDTDSGFSGQFVANTWLIACASGLAVCADTIITTVLIIVLRKNRSGIKSTDSLMDVLVLYTITTGLITSLSMLSLFLVVTIAPTEDGIYTAISVLVTKLYANTLLAALNSRRSLHDRAARTITGTDVFGTGIEFRGPERGANTTQATVPVAIELRGNLHSNGTDSYTSGGFGTESAAKSKLEAGPGITMQRDVVVDMC
ncbi:hypothetical protein GSI_11654 [Ganoderma sinense ZZ0214-1]|uniref:DUF6534 domain-containing protein n=1 Tax=Ganoderma sinense ZZ0214-1 TaxID=1077348 RepID=A0A2G8RWK9_9APHY|nr:hypothetical protein GSI_11654 [Ganoderma sinense ZZ0214-1]